MKSRRGLIIGILVLATAPAACSERLPGDLGTLQQVANSCPKKKTVAEFAAVDLSGSGRGKALRETRGDVVDTLVQRAAVCEGSLRVVAFSSSISASVEIYDGEFQLEGATTIARLRQAPKAIDAASRSVAAGFERAATALPRDGSDPVGITDLAGEYISQLNSGVDQGKYLLDAHILTDGIQTEGSAALNTRDLTRESAAKLAKQVDAPTLPTDSSLTFSGIGKETSREPSSDYVRALKTFYRTFCVRTGAGRCEVVTDYSQEN
jgi:hypothetical protein